MEKGRFRCELGSLAGTTAIGDNAGRGGRKGGRGGVVAGLLFKCRNFWQTEIAVSDIFQEPVLLPGEAEPEAAFLCCLFLCEAEALSKYSPFILIAIVISSKHPYLYLIESCEWNT